MKCNVERVSQSCLCITGDEAQCRASISVSLLRSLSHVYVLQVMKRNVERVSQLVSSVAEVWKFLQSCWAWESKPRSITAFCVCIIHGILEVQTKQYLNYILSRFAFIHLLKQLFLTWAIFFLHIWWCCDKLKTINKWAWKLVQCSLDEFLIFIINPCCAMAQYIRSRDYAPVDGSPIYWVCNGRPRNGASGSWNVAINTKASLKVTWIALFHDVAMFLVII